MTVNDQRIPTILDNHAPSSSVGISLQKLLPQCRKLDVATGTFHLGGMLLLNSVWNHLEQVRILLGDGTSKLQRNQLVHNFIVDFNNSIEDEKELDDDLTGAKAIYKALLAEQISFRAYLKSRFHAKLYLMTAQQNSPVDFSILGSSNFTRPGLSQNIELNLFTTEANQIAELHQWYEKMWELGDDLTTDVTEVLKPHLQDYDPFTVYARSLLEYFRDRENPVENWEIDGSVIYPLLSRYQKDGYHQAVRIANKWNISLLCDGVGLGKTFIGLMILERCIRENKRVLLIVPKSARESVWETNLGKYFSPAYDPHWRDLIKIHSHTDFGRDETIDDALLGYYRDYFDVVVIDEAHHFRTPSANRSKLVKNLCSKKKVFMLTATPINNTLKDLLNLINYAAQDDQSYFRELGINHLTKYFRESENKIEEQFGSQDTQEAVLKSDLLRTDPLLKHLLIQRSRKFVKEYEPTSTNAPTFPERQRPNVVNYSLKGVYDQIYSDVKEAFATQDGFLSLAIYRPSSYAKKTHERSQRDERQVIALIRTLFLKRLESSYKSFEASLEDMLYKMMLFIKVYDSSRYEAWLKSHNRWWGVVHQHVIERIAERSNGEEEDMLPDCTQKVNAADYNLETMLDHVQEDANLLTSILSKIYRRFYKNNEEGHHEDPTRDDKLQQLVKLLHEDDRLRGQKVIIFTEFCDTARYLARFLKTYGFVHVEEIDSNRKIDREQVIKQFSPYYNSADNKELAKLLKNPIDILVTTDVLSEGLNLQDASLIINYDLHWNPVRLMQRIGRVDRRMNASIESKLNRAPHLNGKVYFWNFLPPKELEELLGLKQRLDGKILRINATLGIEGALLTPDDPDSSLVEFNNAYEGQTSIEELMSLEKVRIQDEHPDFWASLPQLPRRLFSAKGIADGWITPVDRDGQPVSQIQPNKARGLACLYRMPAANDGELGVVKHYFLDFATNHISEDIADWWRAVRCIKQTKRRNVMPSAITEARNKIDHYIHNTFMRSTRMDTRLKPVLVAWMLVEDDNAR